MNMKTIAAIFLLPFALSAQMQDPESKFPLINEGQMFNVRLVPRAHKIEVYIVGREVADLDTKNMVVTANGLAGKRSFNLDVARSEDHFVLVNPEESAVNRMNLKLDVRHKNQQERFEFKNVPITKP